MRWSGWLVLAVVGGAGCATTPKWAAATTKAEEKFPARAELQTLALKPPKLDIARHEAVAVERWTLEGPFPSAAAVVHVKAQTPWELALTQAAPAVGNALSVDHQCIAREAGRFLLERDAWPGRSLQAFIERRCATLAPHVRLVGTTGTVPQGVTDEQWLAQWKAALAKHAADVGTPDVSGLSVLRKGERAVMVLAASEVGAQLTKPVPLVGAKGTVELRGRLERGGAERIEAAINKGTLGVESCKTLDALTPPAFAFSCPVDEHDARTMLEVAAFDPGRILGRHVVSLQLWPKGSASDTWERPAGSRDVPKGELNPRLLAAVNSLRAGAQLPLLSLAKEQSATAQRLAPHYFSAAFGEDDPLEADRVALGMMAGWDVGLDVVSAGFGSMWLSGTRDLGLFLEFLLDSPFTRKALTEPKATHLAVGPMDAELTSSLAAIFGTYVPLGTFHRKDSEIAVITRLNQLRLDRGLGLAQWTLWPEDESAVVERYLAARRWGPDEALRYTLEKTVEVAKGQVVGYVQLVDDLEHFQFPPEVLTRPDINVFLAVGTYKAEHWAHTRYVVCFVVAHNKDIETVALGR